MVESRVNQGSMAVWLNKPDLASCISTSGVGGIDPSIVCNYKLVGVNVRGNQGCLAMIAADNNPACFAGIAPAVPIERQDRVGVPVGSIVREISIYKHFASRAPDAIPEIDASRWIGAQTAVRFVLACNWLPALFQRCDS